MCMFLPRKTNFICFSLYFRILHICHDVLFKQLCSWLLHGSLFDPYKEFFIQHSTGQVTGTSTDTQEDEDYLGIMGVTGRQLQVRMLLCYETKQTHVYQEKFKCLYYFAHLSLKAM